MAESSNGSVRGSRRPGPGPSGRSREPDAPYSIDEIVVDRDVAETPLARRIFERWKGPRPAVVDDAASYAKRFAHGPDALTRGKRTLLVTKRKGPFVTPCQGMTRRHAACCGYATLNAVENCPMDCTYCVLLGYLANPLVTVRADLDGLAAEIDRARERNGRLLRLGSGELGDSLAFDRLTGLSLDLMRAVEPFEDVMLELKTKTVEIENLLSVPAQENVIVSWSLNAARPAAAEEIGAPPLESRLEAARRCQQHGYLIGFHFDPLIHTPHWEREYRETVDAVFDTINPMSVAYISLGGLRFPPSMKPLIEERFPRSAITSGEFVRAWDGKLRYFRPIRVGMYRRMNEWIRTRAPGATIYLCMESPQVWRDVFGWSPRRIEDVAERLDAGCRKAKLARGAMCAGDRGA